MRINKHFIFYLFITLFLLINGANANGQKISDLVDFKSDEILQIKNEQISTITLKFNNTSSDTIKGFVKLPEVKGIKFLGQDKVDIRILPFKKAFIPIKFTVTNEILSKELYLTFDFFQHKTNQKFSFSTTKLEIPSRKGLRVIPLRQSQNYKQVGDSVFYEVKVINIGNLADNVSINSTYKDYQGNLISDNKYIKLLPSEEKTVRFSKYVNYDLIKVDKFSPMINVYDKDDAFAGNVIYTIYNVNSNRTFTQSNNNPFFYDINYIRLETRGTDIKNSTTNFLAHNEFYVGHNEYSYNINANFNSNYSTNNFFNTWFDYRRKGKGLRFGNISYGNLDIPIYGRGAIFFQNIDASDEKIVAGIVEHKNNLFDDLYFNEISNSLSAFVNTKFQFKENFLESAAIYQQNDSIANMILSNEYKWGTINKWNNNVKLSLGNTSLLNNKKSKNSFALGYSTSGYITPSLLISSSNYYSTPYFSGTRKGNLSSVQRIQKNFENFSIYTSGLVSIIKPKSMIEKFTSSLKSNELKTFAIETGISYKIFKNLNTVIYPRYTYENSWVFNGFDEYIPLKYNSTTLNSTFYLNSISNKSQFIINLTAGSYKIDDNTNSKLLISSSINWFYKDFRIFSSIQKGNSMLLDRFNGFDELFQYYFSVIYKKSFLNNLINIDFSGSINYNEKAGQTYSLSLNSYLKLKDKWRLTNAVNVAHNNNHSSYTKQTYYQLGIQYNLPKQSNNVGERYGNLNVFVYYDNNTNGVFDEGDKIAEDRIVNINDVSFITATNGEISYKKVPYGEYNISVPGQKWFTKDIKINIQNKNTIIAIPMQLTGSIKGKILFESRSKLEHDISNNLNGIVLIFTDDNGKKTEIKTNNRGEFVSYLPIGNYKFYVKEESLPLNTYSEVYMHKITIEAEQTINYPDLILLIKEKKVNIKRFGSK